MLKIDLVPLYTSGASIYDVSTIETNIGITNKVTIHEVLRK